MSNAVTFGIPGPLGCFYSAPQSSEDNPHAVRVARGPGTTMASRESYLEVEEEKKGKSVWKRRFVVLVGGSIYVFKNNDGSKLVGECWLCDGMQVGTVEALSDKLHAVPLIIPGDGQAARYAATTAIEADAWRVALMANVGLDPTPIPIKTGAKSSGLRMRIEKKLAGSAAVTRAGRAYLKGLLDKDSSAMRVFDVVRTVAAGMYGQPKAVELEKDLLKLVVKAAVLDKHNRLDNDLVLSGLDPVVQFCADFLTLARNPHDAERMNGLIGLAQQLEALGIAILDPHMTQSSMEKLRDIFAHLASPQILAALLQDPQYAGELAVVREEMVPVNASLRAVQAERKTFSYF